MFDRGKNVTLLPSTGYSVSVLEMVMRISMIFLTLSTFCGRIHLQHRVEHEEQCGSLIRDLQGQIQQTFATDIQDGEVLQEHYIKRVLQLRKVTITTLPIMDSAPYLSGDKTILLPQGHISSLKELLTPLYSYLWVRPSFSNQQVAALTSEAQHIGSLVLKYVI